MTEETTDTQPAENNNVNISIEQICAAIINTLGSVEVSIENLLNNYGGKSIAINQDPETKAVAFTLADAQVPVETTEDTAQDSE
jgi:hypothetical protein